MERLRSKQALLAVKNQRCVFATILVPRWQLLRVSACVRGFHAFLLDLLNMQLTHLSCLKVVVGTKVGRSKHMRIMPGGALEHDSEMSGPSSVFVGRKLDEHRGAFLLEYPMHKGAVVEGGWESMERVWEVSQIRVESSYNAGWRSDNPTALC